MVHHLCMLCMYLLNSKIPYQLEPISGATGTNADNIAVTKSGVKTSVVSIPQRYMHTPNEVISLDDVEKELNIKVSVSDNSGDMLVSEIIKKD